MPPLLRRHQKFFLEDFGKRGLRRVPAHLGYLRDGGVFVGQEQTCRFLQSYRSDRFIDSSAKLLFEDTVHVKLAYMQFSTKLIKADIRIDILVDIVNHIIGDLGMLLYRIFFHILL